MVFSAFFTQNTLFSTNLDRKYDEITFQLHRSNTTNSFFNFLN